MKQIAELSLGRYGNITGLVDKDARTSFPSALNDTYCDPCPAESI